VGEHDLHITINNADQYTLTPIDSTNVAETLDTWARALISAHVPQLRARPHSWTGGTAGTHFISYVSEDVNEQLSVQEYVRVPSGRQPVVSCSQQPDSPSLSDTNNNPRNGSASERSLSEPSIGPSSLDLAHDGDRPLSSCVAEDFDTTIDSLANNNAC
jgi:hypothetical protein